MKSNNNNKKHAVSWINGESSFLCDDELEILISLLRGDFVISTSIQIAIWATTNRRQVLSNIFVMHFGINQRRVCRTKKNLGWLVWRNLDFI